MTVKGSGLLKNGLPKIRTLSGSLANDLRHIAHCTYYWRKVSRARMFGKSVIEKAYAGEGHAKHCTQIFFSYRPLQEINTRINAGLNSDLAGDSA